MSNKNHQKLEWYQVLIILTGSMGIVLAFFHWLTDGVDIPNGILTILSLIISAALGPNAVSTIKKTFTNSDTSPNPYTDIGTDPYADAALNKESKESKETKPPKPMSEPMSELMEDEDAK